MRTGSPDEVHAILRQLEQNIAAVVERRRQADQQQGSKREQHWAEATSQV